MTRPGMNGASAEIGRLLARMNARGGFPISVLTDYQGFPIASACETGQDPQAQSAVVAMIQKTVQHAFDELSLSATDEISVFDTEGRRLVCRPFAARGFRMILAALIPERGRSHRRLTNMAISEICRTWKL